MAEILIGWKSCARCGETKAITDFSSHGRKQRVSPYCRPCKRAYERDYYEARGREKRGHKRRTGRDVRARMLATAKFRSKMLGVPFNLRRADIVIPDVCPALGIKLLATAFGGSRDSTPSIDRIIPDKGYVRGNIVVICGKVNRIKSHATPDELQRIAEFYSRFVKEY